ncbi:MAG TPA: hypothetical protein VKB55_21855 [Nocardioidaceae bacterium]|nr:hypothetical protein [Nocardioidaceae bacterium]
MTHRTGPDRDDAIRWGVKQIDHPTENWHAACLVFVRSCYHIAARDGSAAAAWEAAEFKHRVEDGDQVPRGVPYFWTGGSEGNGHVVLSLGDGWCLTNDFVRDGKINRAKINDITKGWGQNARGWTEDVNGVKVIRVNAPVRPAKGWDRVRLGALDSGKPSKDNNRVKFALRKMVGNEFGMDLDGENAEAWGDAATKAYAKWQRRLGFTGSDADGKPGEISLRKLGRSAGFDVVS